MYKWTICALMLLGCSTQSGEASKPDEGDLNTFDDYSRWGAGMAGFTAPPSNQVAGGGGSGGGDGAEDGDDGDDTAAAGVLVGANASCSFGDTVCIEPNEIDNEDWCDGVGGTYVEDWCPDGEIGTCELPAGGDFTAGATAYYYGDIDGESVCADAGGSYSGS